MSACEDPQAKGEQIGTKVCVVLQYSSPRLRVWGLVMARLPQTCWNVLWPALLTVYGYLFYMQSCCFIHSHPGGGCVWQQLLILSRVCSHGWRGAQKSTTVNTDQIKAVQQCRSTPVKRLLLRSALSESTAQSLSSKIRKYTVESGSPLQQLPDNEQIFIFALNVALSVVVLGQWSPTWELLYMFSISGDPATDPQLALMGAQDRRGRHLLLFCLSHSVVAFASMLSLYSLLLIL